MSPSDIPSDVKEFLDELTPDSDTVGTIDSSKMVVTYNGGKTRFEIDARGCERLLQSRSTVSALIEALNSPEDLHVELHALDLQDDVLETLERLCMTVDEV